MALCLSLLPLEHLAHAHGVDPLFPCASHSCACKSRKKCFEHCCCFPGKNRKTPAGQPTVATCTVEERAPASPVPSEMCPVSPLLGVAALFETLTPGPDVYHSIPPDIQSPPPRT
jgi:hypothetical protein